MKSIHFMFFNLPILNSKYHVGLIIERFRHTFTTNKYLIKTNEDFLYRQYERLATFATANLINNSHLIRN